MTHVAASAFNFTVANRHEVTAMVSREFNSKHCLTAGTALLLFVAIIDSVSVSASLIK